MKIKINQQYKSINPCEFELPDFCVLTGKNGSGKSHLLQAIADNTSQISINGKIANNVKSIPFNGLNPYIIENCNPTIITQHIQTARQQYQNALKNIQQQHRHSNALNIQNLLGQIHTGNNQSDNNTKNFITRVINNTKKDIDKLTEDDFANNFDIFFTGQDDFFTAQFALIFKNYHIRQEENDYNKYCQTKGKAVVGTVLSKTDFDNKYGIPPWNFVNNILSDTHILYEVNNPDGTRKESLFDFKLKDKEKGFEISSNDLSTGEKVLMCLALAIYNTNFDIGKPDLLLIDEPDAGLHPAMSKLMVKVLKENIVEENNIPVIITTHSPTTVIASEGTAIYKMERGNCIPQSIPIQEAVEILTCDIPFLKISTEKRRQVFVENQNDVNFYEKLINIYSKKEELPSEPKFISTRKSKHSGSNCSDVIELVNKFSEYGNDTIYGIIDRDINNTSKGNLLVLGEGARYAIENYILDPLLMGILFIRETNKNFAYFGITILNSYPDLDKLDESNAQIIVNKVLEDLELQSQNFIDYKLYNGWKLKISKEFNDKQGHDLEELYKTKYPFLKVYHQEGDLKKAVIDKVINDYPQYAPKDIIETIKKIK
jgi:ABC-type multidrug transport system ATPase subunit